MDREKKEDVEAEVAGGLSVLVGVDEPEEVSVDPKTVERTVRAVSMWPLYLVIPFFYTKTKGRQRVRRRSERPQMAQSVHMLTKTCGCKPRYCEGPKRVSALLNDKTHIAKRSLLTGVSNAITAMTLGHKSSSGCCLCACMRNTESAISNPPIL